MGSINQGDFLRSINIVFDADEPERIAHYFPTEKSAGLLRKILSLDNERSLLIVAPYGSGKSMVAAYALHSVENRKEAREHLKSINEKLGNIDDSLYRWQQERIKKWSQQGLVIAISGFADDVCRQLLSAACLSFERLSKREAAKPLRQLLKSDSIDLLDCMAKLKKCVTSAKLDRVLILWDEFGRHLETLVTEGKSAELSHLQTLAEFTSRQKKVPFSLSLMLHQGFLSYATNLPQSLRREWKKIEGRFLSVNYVEDSREIYRLIGEIVSARFVVKPDMSKSVFHKKAGELLDANRFLGFKKQELGELLRVTYPLSPIVIELLPRIAARVSQNERTLFNFLFDLESNSTEVNSDTLFDYFSDQMHSDVDVGGTHRQWVETQSALSKVSGDKALELVIKTTCLLGLGLSGERARATKSQVALAVAGWGDISNARDLINELIDRKLLLHRKYSNEVSVWHGADLDLRGRLIQLKSDKEAGFDLISFLTKEAIPPTWKPQDYNDEFSIQRFFTSIYSTVNELSNQDSFFRTEITMPKPDEDGRIVYLIPQTTEDVQSANLLLKNLDLQKTFQSEGLNRVVFALPQDPLPLNDAALEVYCLLEMEQDKELIAEDPLILPEIQQMLDDARQHLQQLIDRLTLPKPERSLLWYHQGQTSYISSARVLRSFLSSRMREVFSMTPNIRNELIVRRKPSAVVVNARKKLLLGILERNGQSMFGIQGNFPDASICRTVLIKTGLYRLDSKSAVWGFATPKEIENPALRRVWQCVEEFFTEPDTQGKNPKILFDRLAAPPFGLRAGLFPILFAAGLKTFAYATSLARNSDYIADVLPSDVEQLCKEPDHYVLKVYKLEPALIDYLKYLNLIFSDQGQDAEGQDLIRVTFESIKAWLQNLPEASLSTQSLSSNTLQFRNDIQNETDPFSLLIWDLPGAFGLTLEKAEFKKVYSAVESAKFEVESVVNNYRQLALDGIKECLSLRNRSSQSTRARVKNWADCFVDLLPTSHSGATVLNRMRMEYRSDDKMVESVVAAVTHISLSRWEDQHLAQFQQKLRHIIQDIEQQCLQSKLSDLDDDEIVTHLEKLLSDRISSSFNKLKELSGDAKAENTLNEILTSQSQKVKEYNKNEQSKRSSRITCHR